MADAQDPANEQTRQMLRPSATGYAMVRMHVKLLRQLEQRLLALHGSRCHLRLETRERFRRGRLLISAPVSQPSWLPSGRKSTYLNVLFCQATSTTNGLTPDKASQHVLICN